MASILGSVSGPQNGGRFVGKISVAGLKMARVLIVSARTRQKFSMPLLFHGFVLHTLRTFMATHVLELMYRSEGGMASSTRGTVHESFDSDCVEGYRKKDFFENR